ncbi:hypothetical protein MHPYR_320066 [uncultured Mycobacterium sp.]|uniref:Uncharacterized protein n=1 Tax=uncultured Mycobacterium sp. TaxID=171292 RepID=A0A1Y5PKR2_9MYCO|nr:hypothetical protein MHPYR_320066 [uncultured Mycobacterium sp.]
MPMRLTHECAVGILPRPDATPPDYSYCSCDLPCRCQSPEVSATSQQSAAAIGVARQQDKRFPELSGPKSPYRYAASWQVAQRAAAPALRVAVRSRLTPPDGTRSRA